MTKQNGILNIWNRFFIADHKHDLQSGDRFHDQYAHEKKNYIHR